MPPEHATVGELLGITLTVEPPRFEFGCEPAECPPRRPPRRRAGCLDRRKLVPFHEAVLAGAPDADVARASGLTVSQVRGWRLRLGIRRKPGATTAARITGALLTAPELAQALRAMGKVAEAEPQAPVRISYEELEPFLREHGRRESGFRERASTLGRRTS